MNQPESIYDTTGSIVTGTQWVPIDPADLVRFRQFGAWRYGVIIDRHPHGTWTVIDTIGAVEHRNHRDFESWPDPRHPLFGKDVRIQQRSNVPLPPKGV
jgi:hypothetical protein